jgi:hypothetical protein
MIQAPNNKHQITDKFQIPMAKIQNVWSLKIGIYLEFEVCNLIFISRGDV